MIITIIIHIIIMLIIIIIDIINIISSYDYYYHYYYHHNKGALLGMARGLPLPHLRRCGENSGSSENTLCIGFINASRHPPSRNEKLKTRKTLR